MKKVITTSLKGGKFGVMNYNGLLSKHRNEKNAIRKMNEDTKKGKDTSLYEIVALTNNFNKR